MGLDINAAVHYTVCFGTSPVPTPRADGPSPRYRGESRRSYRAAKAQNERVKFKARNAARPDWWRA